MNTNWAPTHPGGILRELNLAPLGGPVVECPGRSHQPKGPPKKPLPLRIAPSP